MQKIIIISLGGLGTRFKNADYTMPKPLVNVLGKPVLYWLLENLDLEDIEYIYLLYRTDFGHPIEGLLQKDFPKIKFKYYCCDIPTQGVVHAVQLALRDLESKEDKHVICFDNDNFFTENIIKVWNGNNMIVSFKDDYNDPIFSYVKTDDNNQILDIKEKVKISDYACCGIYAFQSLYQLLDACDYVIRNDIREKNEFYMSIVVKHMITEGKLFDNKLIDKSNYHCLGTPFQVKLFCNNYKQTIMPKRYCFDLDNTLVTFPKINDDYSSVEPISKNIKMVRYLKQLGHTIIIHTARRMRTHHGNIGKVTADIGKLTLDTLDKFDIPYDEIYFGKPQADYYIDDLAISTYSNLEKELGFYKINIDPRYPNEIHDTENDIIKKTGNDLEPEIYYYRNIPSNIKQYFPQLINYDQDNKWYQIEKINGIPISKLYLSGELTINILKLIMEDLGDIQKNNIVTGDFFTINIYANYVDKIKKRYNSYDYSRFKNSSQVCEDLIEQSNKYQQYSKGRLSVIHGDPVFTNILLDEYHRIKFIDMRGKVGEVLSIYGDWLYDWGKLYQSLIGYDEILEDTNIDLYYKQTMIDFFKNEFIKHNSEEDFENLKLITKSLLFSLIPLHNNEKCNKYYNLIYSPHLT